LTNYNINNLFLVDCKPAPQELHSFPTRRSSDLARLQIGECRAKQSKWADAGKEFQAVYYAYDIPELKFAAMLEHARVLVEDKKRSEEHTSELQSPYDLVCRLLLEKKKKNKSMIQ